MDIIQPKIYFLTDNFDSEFVQKIKKCVFLKSICANSEIKYLFDNINDMANVGLFVILTDNSLSISEILERLPDNLPKIIITNVVYSNDDMINFNDKSVIFIVSPNQPVSFLGNMVLKYYRYNQSNLNKRNIHEKCKEEKLHFVFTAKELIKVDFVSYIKDILRDFTDDYVRIITVFSELLTNVIEHSILELKSEWKSSELENAEDKFNFEYKKRINIDKYVNRLVKITFLLERNNCSFSIEDEGIGFDYSTYFQNRMITLQHHGMGLNLIKGLVDDIYFENSGRKVVAKFNLKKN